MKKLLICFVIIILFNISISAVLAGSVPVMMAPVIIAAAGANQPNENQRSNGCVPPVEWAIENSCDLKYKDRWSVNDFECYTKTGHYEVKSDCNGKVVSSNYVEDADLSLYFLIGAAIIVILFLFGLWMGSRV